MHYFDGHWGGMHLIWWIIWFILLIWIFFVPSDLPYQKTKNESPLDILKIRYAKGEITKDEYEESKRMMESNT